MRYNHGYQHCIGTECGKRGNCLFYLAYEEAASMGMEDIKTFDRCHDMEKYTVVTIQ